jgi:hypothetical protein
VKAVYISGPITGTEDWPGRFAAASAALLAAGLAPINPAAAGVRPGWTWGDYIRHDLELLRLADAIVLLPGWEQSRGARVEAAEAKFRGLPILTIEPDGTIRRAEVSA